MATGLDALGDHRIGAGGLHQGCFLRRGGTDQYADARRLQRANLVAGRAPKWKLTAAGRSSSSIGSRVGSSRKLR